MTKRFIEILYGLETDEEKRKYLEEKVRELPLEVITEAVEKVKQVVQANNPELFFTLKDEKEMFGYRWVERTYFGFGIRVRNMLRDLVCDDDGLPEDSERDWSFYYAQIVEMALNLW